MSKLPKGYTLTTKCPTVWVTRGRRGPSSGCIYLHCASDLETKVLCTNEVYILGDFDHSTDSITDEQALEIFNEAGWSVNPTRCPACIAKGLVGPNLAHCHKDYVLPELPAEMEYSYER